MTYDRYDARNAPRDERSRWQDERNQRGVQVRRPEWLVLKRGLHRERRDERGHLVGEATDEVPMRAIWAHYRRLMEDGQ